MDSTSERAARQRLVPHGIRASGSGPGISLVVATYARQAEVRRLFESLQAQTVRDFEVVLVDQNADDRLAPSVERAAARGLAVRHLRVRPPDQSVARNAGLRAARYPIVAFPDDDCWYEPDVLERVSAGMRDGRCRLAMGCWMERGDARSAPCRVLAREVLRFENVIGASMITVFVHTELARAVGGFDQRFGLGKFFGGGEDTDFLFRAIASVEYAQFLPQIRIHHPLKRRAGDEVDWSDLRARARGLGALYVKHRLEWWVVLRGLVGPICRSVASGEVARGIVTSVGRLEGCVAWAARHLASPARGEGR